MSPDPRPACSAAPGQGVPPRFGAGRAFSTKTSVLRRGAGAGPHLLPAGAAPRPALPISSVCGAEECGLVTMAALGSARNWEQTCSVPGAVQREWLLAVPSTPGSPLLHRGHQLWAPVSLSPASNP